jgi:hypothetical protein
MNERLIRRIAFGNFTVPTSTVTDAALTASCTGGAFIPKGAIVTGIRYFALGALTNVSNLKNATINPSIGGAVIGTNNAVASVQLTAAVAGSQAAAGSGVYISVGGPIVINIGSSDSARTGLAGNADIYVEYLYCSSRDLD